MITGELKSKVDRIWNTRWSGGTSNPLSVIEQFTYLLFIKGLDELHTRKEHKAARTGVQGISVDAVLTHASREPRDIRGSVNARNEGEEARCPRRR